MKHQTIRISATLLLIGGVALAEEAGNDALQKRVDALEKRLKALDEAAVTTDDVQGVQNSLDNFKYQYQRDRETKSALSTRALTIGGLVQVRAGATNRERSSTNGPTGTVATTNPATVDERQETFDLGSAQVFFAGNLYRDYAEGRNLTFNLRFGNAAPSAGTNNSFANLLDANVVYSPLPTIDPAEGRLTVTLGQQTLPFGLEANTTDELRPVISSAQFLSPTGLGRREIGLIFRGDLGITYDYGYNYRSSLLSYNVGLVNGNGPNTADNNNYKDIVARIDAKVPTDYNSWLRELRFGVSGYKGRQVLTNAAPAVTAQGNRSRYGFDVYYNHYPFGVTYEYVVTFDEALAAAGTRQPEARGDSHTATLFYNFGQQFLSSKSQGRFDDWWPKTYQPFFRYDRYDPNNEISSNQTDIYTVGFNIFFAETTKFQLNLSRKIEHRPATLASNDSFATNEILTQLQYGF